MYSSPALIPRESYIPSSFLSASSSSSPVEDDSSSRLQLRDRISIPQLSSFTHYRENRSLLSHLFSPQLCTSEGTGFTLFPTSPTNISGSLTYFSSLLCEKLDILSSLPSEISVEILLYLHPEDICSAILVCSRWHQLAQYCVLQRRRKTYVQEKRDEYKKSKENYMSVFAMPNLYNQSSPNDGMTASRGPLNNVQPQGSPRHYATSPTNTWIDNGYQQLPKPPSPTYILAEDVNRLSLDEKQQEVVALQRCLFPPDQFFSPTGGRKGVQYNFCSLRRTLKEVAGKKVNRSRLRRL